MNMAQAPRAAAAAGRLPDSLPEELPSATTISGGATDDELLSLSLPLSWQGRRFPTLRRCSLRKGPNNQIPRAEVAYFTMQFPLRRGPRRKVPRAENGLLYDAIPLRRRQTVKSKALGKEST